jgi:hypothetical protein
MIIGISVVAALAVVLVVIGLGLRAAEQDQIYANAVRVEHAHPSPVHTVSHEGGILNTLTHSQINGIYQFYYGRGWGKNPPFDMDQFELVVRDLPSQVAEKMAKSVVSHSVSQTWVDETLKKYGLDFYPNYPVN